ncbi:MMPL family transporter [Streptomyces sp. NBC_01373]|uniref:MMPL family transporter n=1 Tax=Streptomyces sp. NBC_01373 TaxID=2903843 RepID=UPI00224CC242|nr:MMPL family transporter [Streptomyces sp. NBC_01373]MCX4703749.1 MMPL family transporter [Streptomyces sp. NBC_01373]
MSTLLYRLGRFSYRRKGTVFGAWFIVLLVAVAAAVGLMKPFESSTTIPGTEAQRALDVVESRFPTDDHLAGKMVFRAPDGATIASGAPGDAVAKAVAQAESVPGVRSASAPSTRAGTVSSDGRTGIAQLAFTVDKGEKITEGTKHRMETIAEQARGTGLTVELGGDAFPGAEVKVLGPGEAVGVLIALGVLVFVFRSLRTAIVPIATALVGVAVGVLGLMAMTSVVTMDSTSIILAVMLGMAVGIDYALFIVSRHQTQVRDGMEPEASAGLATGTAGGAVVFAGATVVIALAALAVVNIPFLTVMGLGAAATVAVSVLIAVTLLPAVLGLRGRKIAGSSIPVLRRSAERGHLRASGQEQGATAGRRWAAMTARRRWSVLTVTVLGLGLMAVPAADLQLGLGGGKDPDTSAARAQKMIDDSFGPGYSGTLVVLVQGAQQDVMPAAKELAATVKDLPGVASVAPAVTAASGDAALVGVTPTSGPETERTKQVLAEIRDARGGVEQRTGTQIDVTGTTAVNIDVADKLSAALPVYCLLVMGLALLLLVVVFRSIAVPVKAALGFLLSVGASLGAMVAVFQWGWLSGLLGIKDTGPVLSFLPMLLVGILFGLAMDYEVFLVSRMREEYAHGASPTDAMVRGFGHGAKVVTAAALIMIAVFGSFVLADMQVIKGMGFALGIGVLLDAFAVRMALVPAVMAILGERAWWLPRFLHRALPNVDIEGERLTRHLATTQAPPRTVPESALAGHRSDAV